GAEGQVGVGVAVDEEPVRGRAEGGLVPVGGQVVEHDRRAGRQVDAVHGDAPGGGAQEVDDRRRPPQDLLDRGGEGGGRPVGAEPVPLVGVLGEGDQAAGQG